MTAFLCGRHHGDAFRSTGFLQKLSEAPLRCTQSSLWLQWAAAIHSRICSSLAKTLRMEIPCLPKCDSRLFHHVGRSVPTSKVPSVCSSVVSRTSEINTVDSDPFQSELNLKDLSLNNPPPAQDDRLYCFHALQTFIHSFTLEDHLSSLP